MTSFQKRVYEAVRKIPKGKVTIYKTVAKLAGIPRAWRAVGNILNQSASWRTEIPCHRVIRADRTIGGYKAGQKTKIGLLKKEGVKIKNNRAL